MKKISRKEEIEVLEFLKDSDSYLRDEVGESGIEKMIKNIKDDYPIGFGVFTQITEHKLIKAKLKLVEKDSRKFTEYVLEELLAFRYTGKIEYIEDLINKFHKEEIIIKKIETDIPLNDDEKQLVASIMLDKMKSRIKGEVIHDRLQNRR